MKFYFASQSSLILRNNFKSYPKIYGKNSINRLIKYYLYEKNK